MSEGDSVAKGDALSLSHESLSGTLSNLQKFSFDRSYLVDPASSHMLVSKIKPCMSKYKHLYTVKLRTAHYISYSLFDVSCYMDNCGNSRANTCVKSPDFWKGCIY